MKNSQDKAGVNWFRRAAVFSGLGLILASLFHLIDLNNLYVAVSTGDISRIWAAPVLINGGMNSLLLFMTGAWLLFLAGEIGRQVTSAATQALFIGFCLAAFGLAYWFQYPASLQLLLFVLPGLLLLLGYFRQKKGQKKESAGSPASNKS